MWYISEWKKYDLRTAKRRDDKFSISRVVQCMCVEQEIKLYA